MSGHALDSPDRLEWRALFFQVQGGEALPERLCGARARRAAWTALERAVAFVESGLRACRQRRIRSNHFRRAALGSV